MSLGVSPGKLVQVARISARLAYGSMPSFQGVGRSVGASVLGRVSGGRGTVALGGVGVGGSMPVPLPWRDSEYRPGLCRTWLCM